MSSGQTPAHPARRGFSFPLFISLRGYQRAWLRADLIAGLTVWAVLVPEALAYASIAGVSPVVGLYAAPGALLFYAALGSSRHLVTGPMSATAALSAATVAEIATTGSSQFVTLTASLAICTGLAALIAGVLRLGFLASFISEPVLKGFIVGLALTIIVGQLPKLVGVQSSSGDAIEKFVSWIGHLGSLNPQTAVVGVLSLVVVLGLKRFAPVIPASLVAVLLGVIAVDIFGLQHHGVEIVGHIDSGLPSLGLPGAPAHDYGALAAGAIGIMLVGFAEGLGAAKTYAARDGYEIDVNRELIGLGAANLGAGFSSGMVVNGSLSKTAVNGSAGARTQMSGLFVAVMTIITLLLLTGLFEKLPEATLSAVVIVAVLELVDIRALRTLYGVATGRHPTALALTARPDFLAAIAALLGVVIFDTLPGLFIGIGVSLMLLLYRASRPHVATLGRNPDTTDQWGDIKRHHRYQPAPHVVVLRVEGGLFFANADEMRNLVKTAASGEGIEAVVIDAESIPFVDVTAIQMLDQLATELHHNRVRLLIAHDVGRVRDVIRRADTQPSQIEVYPSVQDAVDTVIPGAPRPDQ